MPRCTPLGVDERLFHLEVAETYGTSRMPARDALLRLANEGYLVGTTRGFMAPTLSLEDVREIFEVRRLLEPQAIAGVAREIDSAAVEELLNTLRAEYADEDGDEMMQANMAFRRAWLGRVRNKRLADTICAPADHADGSPQYAEQRPDAPHRAERPGTVSRRADARWTKRKPAPA